MVRRARRYARRPMRRVFRKKRITRSRRTGRVRRSMAIHHFKRNFTFGDVTLGASNTGLSYTFSLNLLPNVSEFAALYDRYRINKVVMRWIPQITESSINWDTAAVAAGTGAGRNPRLLIVKDYDDAGVAATSDELRQYGNCRVVPIVKNGITTVIIRPAIAAVTFGTALTFGYSPRWKQWIDIVNTNVEHYGVKTFYEDLAALGSGTTPTADLFKIECTMYFSCAGLR